MFEMGLSGEEKLKRHMSKCEKCLPEPEAIQEVEQDKFLFASKIILEIFVGD